MFYARGMTHLRCTVFLTVFLTIITCGLLVHTANYDNDFGRLLKFFEAQDNRCNNVSDSYILTSNKITFNALVTERKQYARTTQPVTNIYNITIQIPTYIDTRRYSATELTKKYNESVLVGTYYALLNMTSFNCITDKNIFAGFSEGSCFSELKQATIILFVGLVTLAIAIICFMVLLNKLFALFNVPDESHT